MKVKKTASQFPLVLLCFFTLAWVLLAISPRYREVWVAENLLTVAFILFLVLTYKVFRLSNTSYAILFAFMLLHVTGSYYAYSEVPLFTQLKETFDLSRNHYDRLVHLLFGIVFFIPLHEFSVKKLRLSGGWSCFFAFMAIIALKGIYEVIEYGWLLATKNEIIGVAYLGMQGDIWDTQKDIFLGIVGAVVAWIGYGLFGKKESKQKSA